MTYIPGGGAPEGTAVLSTGEGGGSKFLREDGDGTSSWQAAAGGGDVTGPAGATDNAPALFDGAGGKTLKDSTPTGTGNPVLQTSPALVTPALGTPGSGSLGSCSDYEGTAIKSTGEAGGVKYLREDGDNTCSWQPVAGETNNLESICTGILANEVPLGSGPDVAAYVATSGTGDIVRTTNPTLVTPALGTPASGNLGSCSDYEGTAIKSTGEGGGTKFLREDGDGTCSWQAAGGGGGKSNVGFSGAGLITGKGATNYLGIGGAATSTEANANFYCPYNGTIKNLYTYVSANASNNAANTITINKGGVGQATTVSYGAGETGAKSDLVNSFAVSAGDVISIEVVNTGSGGGTKDIVTETVTFEYTPS
jgi:hypothetical protein